MMFVAGCMKDKPNVDFSKTGAIAEISSSNISATLNAPSSGLDYFNNATLPYIGSDSIFTVTFDVNIASNYPLNKDITATVGVDDAKRVAYDAANGASFLAQPDSTYSFPAKSAVIKSGTRLATFTVTFYPQKMNPSLSYMLPITITDASGVTISGNLSTIYLHVIGNPLAGVYKWDFTRWDAADSTGPTASSSFVGHTVTFVPDDATTVEIQDNYYIGPRYVLKFTNNNGVLSNFTISMNKDDVTKMTAGGVTITDGPHILIADPVNKIFRFQFAAFNGSASRYLIDKYYK